ncbi:flavodoxin-dependent (E)-4-hydroxy-3-methylbut-2-enyl-diphosphate synthase [Candidatus Aerophobetes bacterium]|nr:flavodoxin-dependent (E)-4-hydroxy-3-methylbut-2-enyl-diphosphate synthase [Candidatus Aerophobetes bacterium]
MQRESRVVKVRDVKIGGGLPPVVQGMAKSNPLDTEKIIEEVKRLKEAGAKIVRIAIPNVKAARNIPLIKEKVDIPLAADVHFNYRLALEVIDRGIDKVRINPGNLSPAGILQVARKAKEKEIPLRVGVNSGSLPKEIIEKISKNEENYSKRQTFMAEAMVDTALKCVRLLEKDGFEDIIISLKSSEVPVTLLANRMIAREVSYPIHIGITATGPSSEGIVKSAVGIGSLLSEGIGDTVRVSLTADSVEEVKVAYQILNSLNIYLEGPVIISCPTCGRCRGDVGLIIREIQKEARKIKSPLRVAVMGCEVNGPGEAMEADIGVACTRQGGVLFKKGRLLNRVKKDEIVPSLLRELQSMDRDFQEKKG